MNITVAVMAHPKRKVQAEALSKQLKKYPFMDVTISYDGVDAHTHQDEWNNGKRALMAGHDRGDWHVVIQDDAILTPNFYENLEGAIASAPTKTLISLYTGMPRPLGSRVKRAVNKVNDETWLSFWLLMWGVGLLLPSGHIKHLVEFVDDRTEPYDTRIGIFYQRNMLPVYYTMPSLVDHNDDMDSLLDHGKAGGARVAHRVATGPVRWNRQVIPI
jgi:hypothetical protein